MQSKQRVKPLKLTEDPNPFTWEVSMETLANQKMRKNRNSYVKTLDSFFDLRQREELSSQKDVSFGQIRVILFLEDLGPVEVYKEAEERIDQEILEGKTHDEVIPRETENLSLTENAGGVGLDSRGRD